MAADLWSSPSVSPNFSRGQYLWLRLRVLRLPQRVSSLHPRGIRSNIGQFTFAKAWSDDTLRILRAAARAQNVRKVGQISERKAQQSESGFATSKAHDIKKTGTTAACLRHTPDAVVVLTAASDAVLVWPSVSTGRLRAKQKQEMSAANNKLTTRKSPHGLPRPLHCKDAREAICGPAGKEHARRCDSQAWHVAQVRIAFYLLNIGTCVWGKAPSVAGANKLGM